MYIIIRKNNDKQFHKSSTLTVQHLVCYSLSPEPTIRLLTVVHGAKMIIAQNRTAMPDSGGSSLQHPGEGTAP